MGTKRAFFLMAFVTTLCLALADIQAIDVEPVMKKEQPDFEDDTGLGALPMDGMTGSHKKDNESSDIFSRFLNGNKLSFTHAFVASLSVIVVSELGDKTFFIAAIMAMSHPRLTVFAGAMTALFCMHMLSALFGFVITVIPRIYTFYASTALFALFGVKMLREGFRMSPDEGKEELEGVQSELSDLRKKEENHLKETLEEGGGISSRNQFRRNKILRIVSRIFFEALTLTFLAEWGDRSQIATVVLATSENVYGIIVGGLLGHTLCTGLAVIGGRMIASKISIRTVTITGGVVFLLFAVSSLIIGP